MKLTKEGINDYFASLMPPVNLSEPEETTLEQAAFNYALSQSQYASALSCGLPDSFLEHLREEVTIQLEALKLEATNHFNNVYDGGE